MKTESEEILMLIRTQGADSCTRKICWTEGYRPFVMGGRTHYVLAAELPVMGPLDLGGGFTGYLALHPTTEMLHVVESETGAFVGTSLEEVRKDIREGAPDVMKYQIMKAKKRFEDLEGLVSAEVFWSNFRS